MVSFHWNKKFETGIWSVDAQHRRLVDVINRFGELLVRDEPGPDQIQDVFAQLTSYAEYHFREEERLMSAGEIDPRHFEAHIAQHRSFLDDVGRMHAHLSPGGSERGRQLLDFLCHWLVYHILGQDQSMARQLQAIEAGTSALDAFDAQEEDADRAMEPLLVALSGLFEIVSTQNEELRELNQSLERKVADRTRELVEANRRLEDMARSDPLTGLPNRRHAMERLAEFWEQYERKGSPFSVLMVDADEFKEVNDTYGHHVGDKVLRELARVLLHAVRSDDVVCRLGGDEFLIICPGTVEIGATTVAATVQKWVEELRVSVGSSAWVGSVSVGIAVSSPRMQGPESLLRLADQGVYAAKRAGRNCARVGAG